MMVTVRLAWRHMYFGSDIRSACPTRIAADSPFEFLSTAPMNKSDRRAVCKAGAKQPYHRCFNALLRVQLTQNKIILRRSDAYTKYGTFSRKINSMSPGQGSVARRDTMIKISEKEIKNKICSQFGRLILSTLPVCVYRPVVKRQGHCLARV